MSGVVPDVVSRYFDFDAERDIESIVALFASDAEVVDEGEARHGTTEMRAWQPARRRSTRTPPRSRVPKRSATIATSSPAA